MYKRYINEQATGAQMIYVSRVMVVVWGIFSGIIATILNNLGVGLGWVYGAMGNFIGSAVVPICMAITWKDCNAMGAIAGAWSVATFLRALALCLFALLPVRAFPTPV